MFALRFGSFYYFERKFGMQQVAGMKSPYYIAIGSRFIFIITHEKESTMPKRRILKTLKQQGESLDEFTNSDKDNIRKGTAKTRSKLQKLPEAESSPNANEHKSETTNERNAPEVTTCMEDKTECTGNEIDKKATSDDALINDDTMWKPLNWEKTLQNIRKMRSSMVAPVDTMGCHKCHDQSADEKTQRFQILVALMLSSQTKDDTTYQAMARLKEQTLTPQSILDMKLNVLENILRPVSFYKTKAKHLQQTAKILSEKYDSDIPDNVKDLVALPGVGPKMAHICMSTAWHKVTGIGVDVHVHRICNRLGWIPKISKVPEQTRLMLEEWLPRDLWSEVNYLLVGFGQTICTPTKPNCSNCLNNNTCPFPKNNLNNKNAASIKHKSTSGTLPDIIEKAQFKKPKINKK